MINGRLGLGMLVVVLVLGMTVIGCGDSNGWDSALNGTWVSEDDVELILNNGKFVIDEGCFKIRGNVSTSGVLFTLEATEIYFSENMVGELFDFEPGWKTFTWVIDYLLDLLDEYPEFEDFIGPVIKDFEEIKAEFSMTGTYSISGNKLSITFEGETVEFTRTP